MWVTNIGENPMLDMWTAPALAEAPPFEVSAREFQRPKFSASRNSGSRTANLVRPMSCSRRSARFLPKRNLTTDWSDVPARGRALRSSWDQADVQGAAGRPVGLSPVHHLFACLKPAESRGPARCGTDVAIRVGRKRQTVGLWCQQVVDANEQRGCESSALFFWRFEGMRAANPSCA